MSNDNYFLSLGNDEDKIMNVIDIKIQQLSIFSSRFTRPILSIEVYNEFIILCGTGFIKIYNYGNLLIATPSDLENKNLIQKSKVELGKLNKSSFICTIIYENQTDKNLKNILNDFQCIFSRNEI